MPELDRRALPRHAALATAALVGMLLVAAGGVGMAAASDGPSAANGPASVDAARRPEPRELTPDMVSGYRLPFPSGIEVPVHQGWFSTYTHNGKAAYAYDFGLQPGTPVLAAADGVVAWVHDGETACGGPELLDAVNYVTIDHPDGSATQYGHLASTEVEVGQVVVAGEEIGTSGDTGYTGCLPHLHFARQVQGGPVTQSLPIYFGDYPGRQFVSGNTIEASDPVCPVDDIAGLTDTDPEPPLGAFCGTYFGPDPEAPALFTRLDPMLAFDWTETPPGGYWLDDASAGFSARWSGRFVLPRSGPTAVALLASGWVRVYLDGQIVVNRWVESPTPAEVRLDLLLNAGIHRLDVELTSRDGLGVLRLGWGPVFAGT